MEVTLPKGDYVIIPTTFEPGKERNFSITVYSTEILSLNSLNPNLDWKEASILGDWKGRSAGGCFSNHTWKNNPQFRVKVTQRTLLNIVLSKMDVSNLYMGFYVFKADSI